MCTNQRPIYGNIQMLIEGLFSILILNLLKLFKLFRISFPYFLKLHVQGVSPPDRQTLRGDSRHEDKHY